MDDKWFKAQQKRAGVTAEDIAARMGRARSNVSHIYSGKQRMSLEWARAFSEALQVPLDEVLKRAGALDEPEAQRLTPDFNESDAIRFSARGGAEARTNERAEQFGGNKAGIDVWRVKGRSLMLCGYMPGDFILVDTNKADQCRTGDIVLAQKHSWKSGSASTILRRFDPPVLTAFGPDPEDQNAQVIDGTNLFVIGKIIASWREV